ncbi:autophagy protein 12-like [Symsagittifera roscoffensis]|uniref:autophagy protein 12-like n=1 Tax=Symsagittifera roscoffensis TaxID=84072 RepID=UPI00307B853F
MATTSEQRNTGVLSGLQSNLGSLLLDPDLAGGGGEKIEIMFQPVGSAPILKQKKFKVDPHKTIEFLHSTLKRLLKLTEGDSMFLYVNQAFAPSLDSVLKHLHDCYNIDGKLMIHYCTTQAWG